MPASVSLRLGSTVTRLTVSRWPLGLKVSTERVSQFSFPYKEANAANKLNAFQKLLPRGTVPFGGMSSAARQSALQSQVCKRLGLR